MLEAARLSEADKCLWLREQGIHEEHLTLWEQELRSSMANKQQDQAAELAALKKKLESTLGVDEDD
ncbi:hypothetical protein [Gracilinema caldarium]|uniref:hypothetical protein n=1 Tax=Gracilinema caldarium TaxID=215591 RepID=UPI00068C45C7|nr:hypothetical protein [Gracilinema caldarium]